MGGRIPRARLPQHDIRRIADLIRLDVSPCQDPVVVRIRHVEVHRTAARIQCHGRGAVHLDTLHAIDSILIQVGLTQRPVRGCRQLRVRHTTCQQRDAY